MTMKYTELKISPTDTAAADETESGTAENGAAHSASAPASVQPIVSDAARKAASYVPSGLAETEKLAAERASREQKMTPDECSSGSSEKSGSDYSDRSGYPRRIAIITGASSGLGREFVRQIDSSDEENFDEIWVIARRRERLEALQKEVITPLRVVPLDLTRSDSIEAFQSLLREENPVVGLLINAAGFGRIGSYQDISLEDIDNMISLNCRAAVDMTQTTLPFMVSGSRIVEICSTAGFQPFPYLNVYAATKAFLYRYSRALRVELLPRGISVTAVCPYWVKDTEFISGARKTRDSHYIHGFPLSTKMTDVVRHALLDSQAGFAVSTPGLMCTIHRFFSKICPDTVMMGFWELIRRL